MKTDRGLIYYASEPPEGDLLIINYVRNPI